MAMAQAIIAGAMEQCTKDGYKVSVVIVDKAGLVAASLRGDGTNPHMRGWPTVPSCAIIDFTFSGLIQNRLLVMVTGK